MVYRVWRKHNILRRRILQYFDLLCFSWRPSCKSSKPPWGLTSGYRFRRISASTIKALRERSPFLCFISLYFRLRLYHSGLHVSVMLIIASLIAHQICDGSSLVTSSAHFNLKFRKLYKIPQESPKKNSVASMSAIKRDIEHLSIVRDLRTEAREIPLHKVGNSRNCLSFMPIPTRNTVWVNSVVTRRTE